MESSEDIPSLKYEYLSILNASSQRYFKTFSGNLSLDNSFNRAKYPPNLLSSEVPVSSPNLMISEFVTSANLPHEIALPSIFSPA